MAYYIGLDLGGTNIKAGLVDDHAKVRAQLSVPTQAQGGPDKVVSVLVDAASKVANVADLKLKEINGIGIGSPGPIDFDRGEVIDAPNMPGWDHVPLQARIAQATGCQTVLENDANAAAFGEYWAGAGRDESIKHMVMFTLGTGIGGGLIIDGKLVHGGFGVGAESGHMIVEPNGRPCACGQRGCLETYASASSTAQRAIEGIEAGEASSLSDITPITSKAIFQAAETGDAFAMGITDDTARYLAIGCINMCRLLDPQMIVFAGGMILAGDRLFSAIREHFQNQYWHLTDAKVQIVPALLGNDAGFIGAAAVARAHFDAKS